MRFSKTILKNGLRVVAVPMQDNPTVTVLVLVEAGSKYESKKLNGISHFLEHMCFKGTLMRPRALDISKELDALGSQYNAFTGQEYTGYYAKSDARHFTQIFDIISDIYLNSTFPEPEIEKEKGVIVEEINMYEDMPHRHVQDLIMKLLYGDQPAGWGITGEKENIRRMKRQDFVGYRAEHYVPGATVIVVAGKVSRASILREAKRVFGKIPSAKKSKKIKTRDIQKRPQVLVKFKQTDQTHFVLAFRTYDIFSKKNAALSVLAGILGGGMSSRLFQKLREEMGVGYYVRGHNDPYTDHGFLQISAGVDNTRIEEVVRAIMVECQKLKTGLIESDELEKVKEFIVGNMKLALESTDDIANFFGEQELLKRELVSSEEKAKRIRNVTAQEIRKLAQEIFQNKKLNLALVGPLREEAKFLRLFEF